MTRKSKQAGGNLPLTYHERTKKFASSEYGTTKQRLSGASQYQLGDCALSLTRLEGSALCSPSGYLYSESAILEYLLTKTQQLKEQRAAYERQEAERAAEAADTSEADRKRRADFEASQSLVKRSKSSDPRQTAADNLKRTSYWLADAQPDQATAKLLEKPPERPPSPCSATPGLRRKDLWPVQLEWQSKKLVCAVSEKPLTDATAYWTDKKQPGVLVQTSVYEDLIAGERRCPLTSKKVRETRRLQKSGTSFSTSTQQVEVKKYAPTIT